MTDTTGTMAPEAGGAAPPAGPPMSETSRVIGVFFSPIRTFQDIARRPTWIVPIVLLTIFSVVATVQVLPKIDFDSTVREALEKRGTQMEESQIENVVAMQEKFGRVFGGIAAFLGPLVVALFVGLVYFAIIRIGKGGISYKAAFCIYAWAWLVTIPRGILFMLALTRYESVNPNDMGSLVPSNVGFFFEREQVGAAVASGMQWLDIFTIWALALVTIGYAFASKWNRSKCALAVFVPWAVALLISVAVAKLTQG